MVNAHALQFRVEQRQHGMEDPLVDPQDTTSTPQGKGKTPKAPPVTIQVQPDTREILRKMREHTGRSANFIIKRALLRLAPEIEKERRAEDEDWATS